VVRTHRTGAFLEGVAGGNGRRTRPLRLPGLWGRRTDGVGTDRAGSAGVRSERWELEGLSE